MAEEKRWRVEGRGGGGRREGGGGGGRREGRRVTSHPSPTLFPSPFLPFIFSIIFLIFVVPLTNATFDFVVRPEFGERSGDLNVTTFAGQTAHLPCTVKHLAGKRVSWIRGRDLQVLSTGRITFSTDVRISVLPGVNKFKSRTARSVTERTREEEEWRKEEEEEMVWRKQQENKEEEEWRKEEEVWRKKRENKEDVDRRMKEEEEWRKEEEEEMVWRKRQENKEEEEWRKEEEVWRKKRENKDVDRRMKDKEEEGRRIEMVMVNSSSSSSSSSSSVRPHHTTPPPPPPPLPSTHTPHHTFTHHHHHHHHTANHTHHKHHHHHPPPSPPRRKRELEWSPFFSPQHHYHQYHEEDTISGLGGTPAWFQRELARFNYEARLGGRARERGRSYTSDQQTPIAIYPQGPLTQDTQGKGHVPGPNYIEGVWEPEDYTLQIKYTKPEDAGTYICQINTEPRITQAVRLNVVNMRAEIVGSRELYVKAGTPVTLACKVNHGTLMPGFILWYKGDRLVEYDTSGGRISVTTEPTGVSHLLLRHATPADSANYTCSPSAGAPASLTLNVIVDERQAAMQQGNAAPPAPSPHHHLLPPTLALMWGSCGGLWGRLGGMGVLLVVGEALARTPFPSLLLLPSFPRLLLLLLLPLFFFVVLCVIVNLRFQKRGRFK